MLAAISNKNYNKMKESIVIDLRMCRCEKMEGTFVRKPVRRPLLVSWILSYVVVLIVMLVLCAHLYNTSSRILENSIRDLQSTKVQRYQAMAEDAFGNLKMLANQIYLDVDYANLVSRYRSGLKSTDYTDMNGLRTLLGTSLRSLDCVEEILLYLKRSDYGITSKACLPLAQVYSTTSEAWELWGSYEELTALLSRRLADHTAQFGGRLYYSCGLSHDSRVLFTLDSDELLSLYGTDDELGETIALIGADGTLLCHSGSSFPLKPDSLISSAFDNAEYLTSIVRLPTHNVFAVSLIPRHALNAALHRNWVQMITLMFGASLLCFLFILFFVHRHYSPIRELLTMANAHGLQTDVHQHEYDQLQQLLQKGLDARTKLTAQESRKHERQQDLLLYQELSGPDAADMLEKCIEKADRNFASLPYWCYVELMLVDSLDPSGPDQDEEALYALAQQLIHEVLEQDFSVVDLCKHQRLLLLVGLSSQNEEQRLLLADSLNKVNAFLQDHYACEFQCFITAILPVSPDVAALSVQLMEQLSQMRRLPSHSSYPVQFYRQMEPVQMQMMDDLQVMAQNISSGDAASLDVVLSHFTSLSSLYQQTHCSPPETSREDSLSQQLVQLVQNNYFDPSLNVSTIAQQLGHRPDELSRAFRQSMNMGPLEYIRNVRIKAAIDLLLSNPQLQIKRICELCGYTSIDSFQRAFKRVTGTTPGKFRTQELNGADEDEKEAH